LAFPDLVFLVFLVLLGQHHCSEAAPNSAVFSWGGELALEVIASCLMEV
jgi:hypothetical protein